MEPKSTEKNVNLESLLESTKAELIRFRNELESDNTSVKKKFTELTEDLKLSLREIRHMIQDDKSVNRKTATALEKKLEILENHLNSSASRDVKDNLKTMMESLSQILVQLMESKTFYAHFPVLYDRVHRFRIKAEILHLKIDLGKLIVAEFVREKRKSLDRKIERWDTFRNEISKAYAHMHQAFTNH